ncbi:MAG: cysteine desulfurase, partial [Firmicutes bacterium HGW-Firmicutes-11]
TLNLPGIIGLSAALDYINEVGIDHIRSTELSLARRFLESLTDRNDVKVIGRTDLTNRCPIVSLDFLNRDNAEISYRLDQEFGIMTRCGLHCAPLAHRSLGTFPSGTVRFSFGHTNTAEEVDRTIEAINKI